MLRKGEPASKVARLRERAGDQPRLLEPFERAKVHGRPGVSPAPRALPKRHLGEVRAGSFPRKKRQIRPGGDCSGGAPISANLHLHQACTLPAANISYMRSVAWNVCGAMCLPRGTKSPSSSLSYSDSSTPPRKAQHHMHAAQLVHMQLMPLQTPDNGGGMDELWPSKNPCYD